MSPHSPKVMTACALITEGMTEPWNWEMGWEDVASLPPGSDVVTTGGKGREDRSCCTATGQTHPEAAGAEGTPRALQCSALAEAARMDCISRKALLSTLAGQSWATSPKVKMYFTCQENGFCSKNKAKENELYLG